MNNELASLKPAVLWKNFAGICSVPHPSKKEEKIRQFMVDFGNSHNLETIVDEVGNVIIKKPATPGMENAKVVVLQGHLDMVPQKNSDTEHNFETDPIQAFVDGEWVKARGTTLGSDNGIGVAAAMAVLELTDIAHGPVEALFTIDEETGMTGAFGLKNDILNADILINMDSEDEGDLYIGCAGGVDTTMKYNYTEVPVPAGSLAYNISITGLKGGHSGLDIPLGRGNSNKIMNRLFWHAAADFGLRISSIDGGSLRNAIPREAFAVVTIPENNRNGFGNFVKEFEQIVKQELGKVEPGFKLELNSVDIPSSLIDEETQKNLIKGVYACPNGVIGMITDMPDVVETSTNLAIVKSENGSIEICTLQRSSVNSKKDDLAAMVRCVFEMAGAEVEHSGTYPGWKPNFDSPILETMKSVYNDKFGKIPDVKIIHAGLECGLIGDVYPEMDLISFGPTIRNPHSPDEMVNIKSVEMFWDFLIETLKNIPQK